MLRAFLASLVAMMLLLVVGSTTTTVLAGDGQKANKRIATLKSTDANTSSGIAKTFVKMGKKLVQEFQVIGTDLQPNVGYKLVVDGINIETKNSDKQGMIEFSYSSKVVTDNLDEIKPLPKAIGLVKAIKNVAIYQEDNIILKGEFASSLDDGISPNFVVPDVTVETGKTVQIVVKVTDPQGAPVTLSVKCDKGNFVTVSGLTLNIAPQTSDVGQSVCTVTATNDSNLFSTDSFVVTVVASNRPPMLATIADQRVRVGDTLRVMVQATDPDGDQLRFAAPNAPVSLTNIGSDPKGSALLTFTPTSPDQGGRVTVQAIDTKGAVAQTSFNLIVDPVVIISSVLRGKNLLFVAGQGFGNSGAKVMINGQDLSSRIIGQTNTTLTVKGARAKANLKAGKNQIVVTANGTSATFIFSLRDFTPTTITKEFNPNQ
jgi:hypothetical protein